MATYDPTRFAPDTASDDFWNNLSPVNPTLAPTSNPDFWESLTPVTQEQAAPAKYKDLTERLGPISDMNGLLEELRNPQKLIDEGYNPTEVAAARKEVASHAKQVGQMMSPSWMTAWAAKQPETEEEWDAWVWKEPTAGEHLQQAERWLAAGWANVALGTVAGLAKTVDTVLDGVGLPSSSARDIADWGAKWEESMQQALPSDPRAHWVSTAVGESIGQAPGQVATMLFAPAQAASNYGQVFNQFSKEFIDAEFSKAYTTAKEAGTVPDGMGQAQWVATLTQKDKEDLTWWGSSKAMAAAIPAAAFETVTEKLLINKTLRGVAAHVPGAKWVEKALRDAVGLPSTHSLGRRIATRVTAGAALEGGQEVGEGVVGEIGKALTITGDFSDVIDIDRQKRELVGGIAGGAAMAGPFATGYEMTRQKGFDWANAVLERKDPNVVKWEQQAQKFADTPDSILYREAKQALSRAEDEAHFILSVYGDTTRADLARAARYQDYRDIAKSYKESLQEWVKGRQVPDAPTLESLRALRAAHDQRLESVEPLGPEAEAAALTLNQAEEAKARRKIAEAELALSEATSEYMQSGDGGLPPLEAQRKRIADYALTLDSTVGDLSVRPPDQVKAIYQGLFDDNGNPRAKDDPDALTDLSPEGVAAWLQGQTEKAASDVKRLGAQGVGQTTTPPTPVDPATPVDPVTPTPVAPVDPVTPVAPTPVAPPETTIAELTEGGRKPTVRYQGMEGKLSVSPEGTVVFRPLRTNDEYDLGPSQEGARTLAEFEGEQSFEVIKLGPKPKPAVQKPAALDPTDQQSPNLLTTEEQTALDQAWDRVNNTDTYYATVNEDITLIESMLATARSRVPKGLNPTQQLEATEQFDNLEAQLRSVQEFMVESRTDESGQQTFGFDAPVENPPVAAEPDAPATPVIPEGQMELAPQIPAAELARMVQIQRDFLSSPERRAALIQRLEGSGVTREQADAYIANIEQAVAEASKKSDEQGTTPTSNVAAATSPSPASKPVKPSRRKVSESPRGTQDAGSHQESTIANFRTALIARLLQRKPPHLSEGEWLSGMQPQIERAVKLAGRAYGDIVEGRTPYRAGNPLPIVEAMLSSVETDQQNTNTSGTKRTLLGQLLANYDETGSMFLHKKGSRMVGWSYKNKATGHGFANDWAKREAGKGDAHLDYTSYDDLEGKGRGGDVVNRAGVEVDNTPRELSGDVSSKEGRTALVRGARAAMNDGIDGMAHELTRVVGGSVRKVPGLEGVDDAALYESTEAALRFLLSDQLAKTLGLQPSDTEVLLDIGSSPAEEIRGSNPALFALVHEKLRLRAPQLVKEFIGSIRAGDTLRRDFNTQNSAAVLLQEDAGVLETFLLSVATYPGTVGDQINDAVRSKNPTRLVQLQAMLAMSQENRPVLRAIASAAMLRDGIDPNNRAALRDWYASMTPEYLASLEQHPAFPEQLREVNEALREQLGNGDPWEFLAKQDLDSGAALIADLVNGSDKGSRSNGKPVRLVMNWAMPATFAQGLKYESDTQTLIHVSPELMAGRPGVDGGQLFAQTVLHEAAHTKLDRLFTAYLLGRTDLLSDSQLQNITELESLREEARQAAIETFVSQGMTPEEAAAALESDRNFRGISNREGLHEFVNEAFNHKEFRDFLTGVTTQNEGAQTTLWKKIVNLITRILSGRKVAMDSVLQRTMEEALRLTSDTGVWSDSVLQRAFLEGSAQVERGGSFDRVDMLNAADATWAVGHMDEFRRDREGNRDPEMNDRLIQPLVVKALENAAIRESARLSKPAAKESNQNYGNTTTFSPEFSAAISAGKKPAEIKRLQRALHEATAGVAVQELFSRRVKVGGAEGAIGTSSDGAEITGKVLAESGLLPIIAEGVSTEALKKAADFSDGFEHFVFIDTSQRNPRVVKVLKEPDAGIAFGLNTAGQYLGRIATNAASFGQDTRVHGFLESDKGPLLVTSHEFLPDGDGVDKESDLTEMEKQLHEWMLERGFEPFDGREMEDSDIAYDYVNMATGVAVTDIGPDNMQVRIDPNNPEKYLFAPRDLVVGRFKIETLEKAREEGVALYDLVADASNLDGLEAGKARESTAVTPGSPEAGVIRAADITEPTRFSNAVLVPPTVMESATVYHGTPHKIDPKEGFRLDKIGSGEGAQAYGWGIYFAENREVGEQYRKNLGSFRLLIDGIPFDSKNPRHMAGQALYFANNDPLEAKRQIRLRIDANKHDKKYNAEIQPIDESALQILQTDRPKFEKVHTGNLYQVELDVEPEDLLDWDKPLSEQSEKVKAFVWGLDLSQLPKGSRTKVLFEAWKEGRDVGMVPEGNHVYTALEYFLGGQKASETLLAAGIPGIRYLDGQSRGGGTGTYNYVIFDPARIKITHENDAAIQPGSPEAGVYEALTGERVSRESAPMQTQQDADYMAAVERGDMETAQRMVDEKLAKVGAYWHGTPSGDLRGGVTGLHIGTKQAAMEALEARIGIPADGKGWDGTREYGKTLLAGQDRINSGQFGKYRLSGYNADAPAQDYFPTKMPTVGNNVMVDPKWKPWLRPVLLVGEMTNTPRNPISDAAANRRIQRKRGAFYTNTGEDYGSVSAVLPSGDSVRVKLADPVTFDDQGNVIPLSQRFQQANPDIRFSEAVSTNTARFNELTADLGAKPTQEQISTWISANPEAYAELEKMRADVLRAAGYDIGPVWHGSESGDFNEFSYQRTARGFFFAPDKRTAEFYGPARKFFLRSRKLADLTDFETFKKVAGEAIWDDDRGRDEESFERWIKDTPDNETNREIAQKALGLNDSQFNEYDSWEQVIDDLVDYKTELEGVLQEYPTELAELNKAAPVSSQELNRAWEAMNDLSQDWHMEYQDSFVKAATVLGYDAVFMIDPTGSTGGSPESYVVEDPNQIKSADPLALDDNGNLITPDQWADETSDDIRFSEAVILGNLEASAYPQPMPYRRDTAKESKVLARVRQLPWHGDIARALQGLQYIPDTHKATNDRANAEVERFLFSKPDDQRDDPYTLLEGFHNASAFQNFGDRVVTKANFAWRVRNARDTALKNASSDPATVKALVEMYNDVFDRMMSSIAVDGSEAGSNLNYMKVVGQLFEPTHWVKQYTNPIDEVRADVLDKSKPAQLVEQAVLLAQGRGAKQTYERMLRVLELAGQRFLPKEASARTVRAAAEFAKALNALRGGATNVEIVEHAVELLVAQVFDNTLRKFEGVPNTAEKAAAIKAVEERARVMAKKQIDAVLAARLQAGVVDGARLTKEQAEAKLWQDIAGTAEIDPLMELAGVIFNHVMMAGQDADTPYSGLFANDPSLWNPDYEFDTKGAGLVRKAVRTSVDLGAEIKKSLNERALTEQNLLEKLDAAVPDLTPEQRGKIAAAVVAAYRSAVAAEAARVMDNLIKDAAKKKDPVSLEFNKVIGKSTVRKLLDIINLGAFNKEDVYNVLAESYGLPAYNKATVAEIQKMAEDLQKLSLDSIQRGEATQQIALRIRRAVFEEAKGADKFREYWKLSGLIWTAGALQGIRTQTVNIVSSLAATSIETISAAAGSAIYLQRNGVPAAQAWGAFSDILGGIRMTFGKNLEGTGSRVMADIYAAMTKGTSRFRTDKLENLSDLEIAKADAALAAQGNAFMEAWLKDGAVNKLGNVTLEGAKLGAKYVGYQTKHAAATLFHALTGQGKKASEDLAKLRNNFMASRKMVGRFMIAADSMTSALGANTKLLLMQRQGKLLGEEGIANKVFETVVAEAKAVVAKEDAEGQFGTPGTPDYNGLKARRLEQLVERELAGGKSNADLAREFGAKGTFNGEAYGIIGFVAMEWLSKPAMALGPIGVPFGSFMRTASNLINYSIETSPYGFLVAARQGQGLGTLLLSDKYRKQYTDAISGYDKGSPEQIAAYVRAGVGTAVYGALTYAVMAAVKGWEDDEEEPWFRIFAAGHPDPRERKFRREAGVEKPYHIRIGFGEKAVWIPYKDYPGVSLPLALAGSVMDKVLTTKHDKAQSLEIVADAMLSGVAMALNRDMMSGLLNLTEALTLSATGNPEQASAKWREVMRGVTGPYLNPGMMKVFEDLATQTRFDSYKTLEGTLLASIPFGQAVAGTPQRNVLNEPVTIAPVDVLAGRFVSASHAHPIMTPLAEAGLYIPPPVRQVVADESARLGVRPPTPEEERRFNQLYGEYLKERLSRPGEVDRIVAMSKGGDGDRQRAQDRLGKLGTLAREHAWRVLSRETDLRKGNSRKHVARQREWAWETNE